jgi:hypothetical protein
LKRLVHFERYDDIRAARQREQNPKALSARMESAVDIAQQSGLGRPVQTSNVISWTAGLNPATNVEKEPH